MMGHRKTTHHVRHGASGVEYLRHETRLMARWCRIYRRSTEEFVRLRARDYAERHGNREGDDGPFAPEKHPVRGERT